jgi:hypothetical protein
MILLASCAIKQPAPPKKTEKTETTINSTTDIIMKEPILESDLSPESSATATESLEDISTTAPPLESQEPTDILLDIQLPTQITKYKVHLGITDQASSMVQTIITSLEELEIFLKNDVNATMSDDYFPKTLIEITDRYGTDFFEENILYFFTCGFMYGNQMFDPEGFFIHTNNEYIQILYDTKPINPDYGQDVSTMYHPFILFELPKNAYIEDNMVIDVALHNSAKFIFRGKIYTVRSLIGTSSYSGDIPKQLLIDTLVQNNVFKKAFELFKDFYSVPGRGLYKEEIQEFEQKYYS